MSNKIESFDRKTVEQVRDRINAALKQIGDEFGIDINLGSSIRYTSNSFDAKVSAGIFDESIIVKSEEGEEVDLKLADNERPYAINLQQSNGSTGISRSHLGKRIKLQGEEYTIIGLTSKKSNASCVLRDSKNRLVRSKCSNITTLLRVGV